MVKRMKLDLKKFWARFQSCGNPGKNSIPKLSGKERRALSDYSRQKHYYENNRRIDAIRDEIRRRASTR